MDSAIFDLKDCLKSLLLNAKLCSVCEEYMLEIDLRGNRHHTLILSDNFHYPSLTPF
jgi:hypothetical protein